MQNKKKILPTRSINYVIFFLFLSAFSESFFVACAPIEGEKRFIFESVFIWPFNTLTYAVIPHPITFNFLFLDAHSRTPQQEAFSLQAQIK